METRMPSEHCFAGRFAMLDLHAFRIECGILFGLNQEPVGEVRAIGLQK